MKIFGIKNKGMNYYVRMGAYAVIFKNQYRNEIGLIRAHGQQYFLPGGGIEQGETAETTFMRFVLRGLQIFSEPSISKYKDLST